jgi:hypothetical protein
MTFSVGGRARGRRRRSPRGRGRAATASRGCVRHASSRSPRTGTAAAPSRGWLSPVRSPRAPRTRRPVSSAESRRHRCPVEGNVEVGAAGQADEPTLRQVRQRLRFGHHGPNRDAHRRRARRPGLLAAAPLTPANNPHHLRPRRISSATRRDHDGTALATCPRQAPLVSDQTRLSMVACCTLPRRRRVAGAGMTSHATRRPATSAMTPERLSGPGVIWCRCRPNAFASPSRHC